MAETYNGWRNYETWNLALWIDNEQGSYEYWRERARDVYQDAEASKSFTRREQAALDLAHELENEIKENTPTVSDFYADVLTAAIAEVDWREITEHWIEDVADALDAAEAAERAPEATDGE